MPNDDPSIMARYTTWAAGGFRMSQPPHPVARRTQTTGRRSISEDEERGELALVRGTPTERALPMAVPGNGIASD